MARFFNGTTMRGYTNGRPVGVVPVTMGFWGYSNSMSGKRCGVTISHELGTGGGFNHFSLGMNGTVDQAYFEASSGTDRTALTTATATMNVWEPYMGIARSPTDRSVYIRGGNEGTNTVSCTPGATTQMVVGCWSRGADAGSQAFDFWSGRLANVCVWDVALSAREVEKFATGVHPLGIRPKNLVYFAPLHGHSSPEPDYNPVSGSTKYTLNLLNSPTEAFGPPVEPYSLRVWRAYPVTNGIEEPAPEPEPSTDTRVIEFKTQLSEVQSQKVVLDYVKPFDVKVPYVQPHKVRA